ncbi:hypothetical protein DFH09DRAFT_562310 [Mycena vulgaris]|nr:hypothetical protein DFH09DRAFT_562310 [Mycena vulgaris]
MLENARRFLNTVVNPKPVFTIPPSDPDPIHKFSTRTRRSGNTFTSHASKTSVDSWASPQRPPPSLGPVGTSTPRKPEIKLCCCSCHRLGPSSPAMHTSPVKPEQGSCSRSIKRTRFEGVGANLLSRHSDFSSRDQHSSKHRREPASHDGSPIKSSSANAFKSKSSLMKATIASARGQRDGRGRVPVSELGELPITTVAVNHGMKFGTYSRMKEAFKSWSSPRPQAARLKKPTRPPLEAERSAVRSGEDAPPCRSASTTTKDTGSGSMSALGRTGKKVYRRECDGARVSVNRFGWPLSASRNSGKGSYATESVPARPEASLDVKDYKLPPRRPSFEVDLSPIMEDITSFPSLDNVHSSFDSLSVLGTDRPDQSRNGGQQEQEYQDQDSRNFDHMNLSGSFVLQSTSCRDIRGRDPLEDESVPALVVTFPTPEQPKTPVFAPQSPFTVHKFVAATSSGAPTSPGSAQRLSTLAVPALPRCTHCGFGFGLDFHDLEALLSNNPCRFCEPQWLACKMWYQARGNSLHEPCAMRPAESNASSRAIVGKLGLPVGSHRGLGIEVVDELSHLNERQTEVHVKAVGEGYSRFSNVIIKDRTKTKRTTASVWKRVTRSFGTADKYSRRLDVDNWAAEPERRRKGLDLRWIGPSALVGT